MSERVITVDVENYGEGGNGHYRAGMAIVRLDGVVVAQLRTGEGIEIKVLEPQLTTTVGHPSSGGKER